jgi:hypothetical protein
MKKMFEKKKKTYKGKRTKKKVFKQSFCTKEDKSSSDEDEFSESEKKILIFMSIENSYKQDIEE